VSDDRRQDWNNSVEKRLVDLNSAQLTGDTELSKLRRESIKTDKILRGDPTRNIKGLIEAINHLETEVTKFNRIFDKDYLGHGGLQSFVTYVYNQLKAGEEFRQQGRGYKWAFWTAVLVAVIGLAGLVLTNKDQIEKWFPKYHATGLDAKIEKAKHPKSPHKVFVTRVVKPKPEPAPEPGPAQEPPAQ
jgi:hypothetical protein